MKVIPASLGVGAGLIAFCGAVGMTGSPAAGVGACVLVGIAAAVFASRRQIVPIDEGAASRGLLALSALATVGALLQLARIAVFIVAPSQSGYSIVPTSDWEVRHSCVSAYFVAAEAASTGASVYDDSLYNLPDDDPTAPVKARMLGPFRVDIYEYPPTFLLLPRAMRLLAPDFLRFRMLWFALTAGVLLLALLVVARSLGPKARTRALLLSPLVWVAVPTLDTLQKGNFQILTVAMSMLAMILFQRRRWAAGGALLGFATVSKLFPGLLLVFLVARREWRAVVWTALLGAAFALLTLADVGWAQYDGFARHLPGLVGGEAFAAFRFPAATAANSSIPGLVFKLKLFGVPGMGFAQAKVVGWLYTALAVTIAVAAGRRPVRDTYAPLVWMAVLIIATLRSPFLPQAYAPFPPLWLLTMLAAHQRPTARTVAAVVLGFLGLNVFWPLDWTNDARVLAVVNLVPQGLTLWIAVHVLRRTRSA